MKKSLFYGLLVILVTGIAISPRVKGQTEISTEKLVGALRTLNTFLYLIRVNSHSSDEETTNYPRRVSINCQFPLASIR